MAKAESDFQRLLSEAPAAPDVDTVTVVGILARTADATHFVLTLPSGRSETLDVDAVKSAKKVAGVIGQSLVELELDAKRIPESLLGFKSRADQPNVPVVTAHHYDIAGGGGSEPAIEIGGDPAAGRAPFVAAMPRQAPPAAVDALTQRMLYFYPWIYKQPYQDHTYLPYYPFTLDHPYQKVHTDPQ